MSTDKKKNIVIIGGGIIGCTTAYFLTRHPSYSPSTHNVTLLEASQIAGGASGKAGGLLALWAYPSNIVPLSYQLHAQLAKEHNGAERWGYRQLHCGQLDAKGRPIVSKADQPNGISLVKNGTSDSKDSSAAHVSLQKRDDAALGKLRAAGFPAELDWIAPECARSYDEMGDPSSTAQVHPLHFTTSMAKLAEEAGVKIITEAHVDKINQTSTTSSSPSVESVSYTNAEGKSTTIPATHVVLSAGPWTQELYSSAPIEGLRAHSVTIKPSRPISAFALFTAISLPPNFSRTNESKRSQKHSSQMVSPEIYARPFNEVYACGEGDSLVPLPSSTKHVVTDQSRCEDIIDYVGSISDELRDGEVTARQACYLPVVRGSGNGGPFIGEVKDVKGLVLAAGHSCWGIQNGPGTGKLVSEIVLDGKAQSAKLSNLDPKRAL